MKSARTTRGFFIVPTYLTVYSRGEEGYILSRLRLTAPSAEGAKGAASADAGFRLCGHDQRTEPVWRLCNRPLETFAPCGGNRWQVAAALSAAVTTTNPIEDASPFRRNQLRKKVATQTPAALRERGSGGEALLSEKRPLPQRLPHTSLREGARGRVLLFREAPSLAITYSIIARSTVRLFSFWRWRDRRRRPSGERCQGKGRSRSASRGSQRIADAFPARQ